ncbi:MAG: hypothetical protein C5B51_12400 [Terriglobia bacterium]|nr:MAG: hypothetical protein C5B51_12400 [Terriglobia bacterium]
MFKGLEHTAIASPNPQKLAQWYVDHLEFRINFQYLGNYFIKAPNGTIIEIIPSEGDRPEQQMKSPGIRHFAIQVDDFDAARAKLREMGIPLLSDPIQMGGNRLQYFTDADGNFIHLIHREQPLP